MSRAKMLTLIVTTIVVLVGYLGWKVTFRNAYESAEYHVLEADHAFQVREYPDLMLASTSMRLENRGDDGSFMRLFRFISGDNDAKQKVAMTTPVFMQRDLDHSEARMGFVMPKQVSEQGVPEPADAQVSVRRRPGGRFAVLRFSGWAETEAVAKEEKKLRLWIEDKGFQSVGESELAGYDPPWTPGPLRRNEILIRIE